MSDTDKKTEKIVYAKKRSALLPRLLIISLLAVAIYFYIQAILPFNSSLNLGFLSQDNQTEVVLQKKLLTLTPISANQQMLIQDTFSY